MIVTEHFLRQPKKLRTREILDYYDGPILLWLEELIGSDEVFIGVYVDVIFPYKNNYLFFRPEGQDFQHFMYGMLDLRKMMEQAEYFYIPNENQSDDKNIIDVVNIDKSQVNNDWLPDEGYFMEKDEGKWLYERARMGQMTMDDYKLFERLVVSSINGINVDSNMDEKNEEFDNVYDLYQKYFNI